MKKILLFLILSILLTTNAYSATYYVRPDGGDGVQCNGLTDAALAGASGVNCAYKHPRYALDWDCPKGLNCGSPSFTPSFSGGDTLLIKPAQYMIGTDKSGANQTPGCPNTASWDCNMGRVPAGIDVNNKTKIYGVGWDTRTGTKPQFWGNERVDVVLWLGGDNIDIRWLEITDHSPCIVFGPADGQIDGQPVKCQRSTSPYGPWAGTGIESKGRDNIEIHDVDIHGMASRGIRAYQNGDWTLVDVNIIGNGWAGWDGDGGGGKSVEVYTGLTSWTRVNVSWNGCGERYPLQNSSNFDTSANMHHCWSQDQGGYGDGVGMAGDVGDWTIIGSDISHNTSDGLDLLYGNGTGTIKVYRSTFEGNAGQAYKVRAGLNYLENSVIHGNCGFFKGQSFTSTKSNTGANTGFNNCRANGDTVVMSNVTGGQKMYIYNSTIMSNGDSAIKPGGTNCDGNTVLELKNSIVYGGREWGQDTANRSSGDNSKTDFYYASGSDGNGTGPCGSSFAGFTVANSIIGGVRGIDPECSDGTNNICDDDPEFTGTIPHGPTTYYTGEQIAIDAEIGATSPARHSVTGATAADETLTFQSDGSIDYNKFARGSDWDTGALEFGTASGTGSSCGDNTRDSGETCDGTDLNNQTCVTQGFASGTLACSGDCLSFDTTSCVTDNCGNAAVDTGEDCDGALLNGGTCQSAGNFNSGTLACQGDCTFDTSGCVAPACADSFDDPGEECDDGNSTEGDGCSSLCENEIDGLELFLTYTETDPNSNIGVATHAINISGVGRNESANVQKSYGSGNFGDFTHRLKVNLEECTDGGLSDITVDSSSETTSDTSTSITLSHTINSGSNRILIVGVTREEVGTNRSISSVTYDGVAMTLASETQTGDGDNRVDQYYLVAPNVGTANVVVTFSGQVDASAVTADSFFGVAQQSPEVTSTSVDTSNTFTTITEKSLAVNHVNTSLSTATLTTPDLTLHNFTNTGDLKMLTTFKIIGTAGQDTMSWTVSGGNSASALAVYAPAGGGGVDAIGGIWSMSSSAYSDIKAQEDATDGIFLNVECANSTGSNTWRLTTVDSGSSNDTFSDQPPNITRHIEIERSGTTLTAKFYSDSLFTTLLDTLTVTTTSTTHEYLTIGASYNDSNSGTSISGIISRLDISAAGGNPPQEVNITGQIRSITITGQNIQTTFPD
jgi:cysteine-rich repeat protein